jgi:phospholipid/cholesterol/gamma-HCH transport system ATP-binding protein
LKLILGLLKPDAGEVLVHGERVDQLEERELLRLRGDLGMVFQEGALFDSLTVGENVGFKFYEDTDMPLADVRRRVEEVLGFVRLGDYVDRRTAELSGGQRRRVAIARAMTSKPGILLYDEATTGLDPITAITVDEEIVKLRDLEGVSSIVVTHQLRDAFFVATHEARRDGDQKTGDKIVVAPADAAKADEAEFIMLKEGWWRSKATPPSCARPRIRTFDVSVLEDSSHAPHPFPGLGRAEDRSRRHLRPGDGRAAHLPPQRGRRLLLAALRRQDGIRQRGRPEVGRPVRVAGVEVGSVKEVKFLGDRVEVLMEVSKEMQPRITSSSVASLGSVSLLGESAVDITASSQGTPGARVGLRSLRRGRGLAH